MSKIAEQITNMRKNQNKREIDRKELADVVEQERLIEIKGKVCCGGIAGVPMFTFPPLFRSPPAQAHGCHNTAAARQQTSEPGRARDTYKRSAVLLWQ